jgi:hypothetical protein
MDHFVRAGKNIYDLSDIGDLAKLLVHRNKHAFVPLVYQMRVLILSVATTFSGKMLIGNKCC